MGVPQRHLIFSIVLITSRLGTRRCVRSLMFTYRSNAFILFIRPHFIKTQFTQ